MGDPWGAVSEDVGHHDWHAASHCASEKAQKHVNAWFTKTQGLELLLIQIKHKKLRQNLTLGLDCIQHCIPVCQRALATVFLYISCISGVNLPLKQKHPSNSVYTVVFKENRMSAFFPEATLPSVFTQYRILFNVLDVIPKVFFKTMSQIPLTQGYFFVMQVESPLATVLS